MAGEKTIVVIAEDDPMMGIATKRLLIRFGYDAKVYEDGQKALDAVRAMTDEERARTMLLTDTQMPNMGGVQLAKTVLKDYPSIPVLMTSGGVDERTVRAQLGKDQEKIRFVDKLHSGILMKEILASMEKGMGRGGAPALG